MAAMRDERAARRLALGGMLALASALGIGRFVYTPILPAMAEGLGLTGGQAGLIASANFCGYLAGALLAAARLPGPRRTWLLGALMLGAATTGATGLASSLPAFLLLRGIGGAASAFVLVFASALVLDRLAARGRGGLAALHFAGVGLGIAASAGLVALPGLGWRGMWCAAGLVSLAAAAAVAWLVPGEDEAAKAPQARVTGDGRWLSWWAVAYGLFGFGYVVTATFLVAIVRAEAALRAVEPFVWLVFGLAAVPSVALWGWAGRRLGLARSFALACLLEAVGVAASVAWSGAVGALAAAALLGGTFMGLTALGLAGGRALAAGDPRRTFAVLTAAFGIGQILGPALAGLLHDRTGSFGLPSLLAAAALLAASAMALQAPLRGEAKPRKSMVRCGNPCSDRAH